MFRQRIYQIVPSFLVDGVFQIAVEQLVWQHYFPATSTVEVAECWLICQLSTNLIVPSSEYCNAFEPFECGKIDPLACKPHIQLNLISSFVNESDDGIALLDVGIGRAQQNFFQFQYQYCCHCSNQLHQKPCGTLHGLKCASIHLHLVELVASISRRGIKECQYGT